VANKTDYEKISEVLNLIAKYVAGLYLDGEVNKKGEGLFACSDKVTDDCQSIHMNFMFDEDGELIGIG